MEINKIQNGEELLIEIDGRLEKSTVPKLEEVLGKSIDGVKLLIFDMKGLTFISSAGLRALVMAQEKMDGHGEIKLRNVHDNFKEVFDATGLTAVLPIV